MYGIMKAYDEISIIIDEVTNCLVDKYGIEHKTEINIIKNIKLKQYKGWNFKWANEAKEGKEVYSLHLLGNDIIEGLIALSADKNNKIIEVSLVESAPHNIGRNKRYVGVGAHLFAIAAYLSFINGFEGFVLFTAKTDLISHYTKKLGAVQIGKSQRMIIHPKESYKLVKKYFPNQIKEG